VRDKPTILVTDDDANTVYAFKRILEDEGYEVLSAYSGNECLRVTRDARPDLILLDIVLPDVSGVEVCRRIKADPALSRIFVIHVSGHEATFDPAFSLVSGADGYLTKPIQLTKMLTLTRAALRLRDAETSLGDQQRREMTMLDQLSSSSRPQVAAQMFGAMSLSKALPDIFKEMVAEYGQLLDLALEQRLYKVEHNISEGLYELVERLGFLKAGPRDVIDLHSAALKERLDKAGLSKTQAYVEEGRMAALELMGHLVSYYRTFYIGARKLRVSNPIQTNQQTQEGKDE
jgi:CheY-like chemotaxis protein